MTTAMVPMTAGPMPFIAALIHARRRTLSSTGTIESMRANEGRKIAAAAIFLPSFALMLSIVPVLDKVRRLAWIKAAMKGIGPAVIGTIAVVIVQLAPHAAPDAFTAAVLALTACAMLAWKLPVLSSLVCGGALGVLARSRVLLRLRELVV